MGEFNNFPTDIMLEILTRLPTESALDCKLVCKPWRDVVRHQSFSQMHFNRLCSVDDSNKLSFIFSNFFQRQFNYSEYDENRREKPFSRSKRMNLNLRFDDFAVIRSCNGLIFFDSSYRATTSICNPITREYIILPESEGKYCLTGFGYILSTNEYKVVRINESGWDSNVGIVQIYTLGSGTGWRNAGTRDIYMYNVTKATGVFANGVLHWVSKEGTTILAFNLADEKFSEFPSPPPCLRPDFVSYFTIKLGVLGNFLSVSYSPKYPVTCCNEIWLLKNKDNYNDLCWTKEFSLPSSVSQPFGLTKSGRLLYYKDRRIRIYDPEASSDISCRKFMFLDLIIPHKNTLVSLKVLGEKYVRTMELGARAALGEETKSSDKLKKPQNKVWNVIRSILKFINTK